MTTPPARRAAIRQVHMINRVDPKVAKLLTGAPGVSIREDGRGPGHYVFVMHCDKAPFDNKDLRMALKYAIKRQEMVDKIPGGFGSIGNDSPINKAYPLFDNTPNSASSTRQRRKSTTRNLAMMAARSF